MSEAITLYELSQRILRLISVPSTANQWVTAELSDVAYRNGHCYMELLQKDASGARNVAKARGIIWASEAHELRAKFYAATGRDFAGGMKLMVKVTANYHPLYGMSLLITDINPEFTMGDLLRRRREIVERLRREGILENNRSLPWPEVPQRIAIISSPSAAGYGDFVNQLYGNEYRLRFACRLFPAIMQGDKAPASIIAALDAIAAVQEEWDCVVIIRGGGATSDLIAFEDYNLAANVAMFPLPVVIGIGHERDITVLDYVANMRVKTPTAAAEWLIGRGAEALESLMVMASSIHRAATARLSGEHRRLAYYEGVLPVAPLASLDRRRSALSGLLVSLSGIGSRRISPALSHIETLASTLPMAAGNVMSRHFRNLDAAATLLDVLSPAATLRRGYSITRVNGHAVTDASLLPAGTRIDTILANGSVSSVVS